jgi:hypothetical protein
VRIAKHESDLVYVKSGVPQAAGQSFGPNAVFVVYK